MKKLFYSKEIIAILLLVITVFSACKMLNYKSTTCGYHMQFVNTPKNSVYLRDYSLYAKAGKDAEKLLVLNKGEYYFYYNHCQGVNPVNAKLELFYEKTGESLCVIDFGLAKTGNVIFTTPKSGTYRIVVQSPEKRKVTFFLLFRKRFHEN